MPCPTCDHTLESLGRSDRGDVFFLCPRCGTVKVDALENHGDKVYVPKLVERCREFERTFPPGNPPSVSYSREWERLGIAEAINPPVVWSEGK